MRPETIATVMGASIGALTVIASRVSLQVVNVTSAPLLIVVPIALGLGVAVIAAAHIIGRDIERGAS